MSVTSAAARHEFRVHPISAGVADEPMRVFVDSDPTAIERAYHSAAALARAQRRTYRVDRVLYDAGTDELLEIEHDIYRFDPRGHQEEPTMSSAAVTAESNVTSTEVTESNALPVAEPTAPTLCLCGCGGTPKRGRFLPGHDAKFKGALIRYERHQQALADYDAAVESADDESPAEPTEPTVSDADVSIFEHIADLAAAGALATCSCCGQPMLAHESGMGPVCRAGRCSCLARRS
jgi:hypothetical protein